VSGFLFLVFRKEIDNGSDYKRQEQYDKSNIIYNCPYILNALYGANQSPRPKHNRSKWHKSVYCY